MAAKILAIDDDVTSLKLVARTLSNAGCPYTYAVSEPASVLDAFRDVKPDLVLLDLNMPSIDGYQLLAMMNGEMDREGAVPIVVLTGDSAEESRRRALELGASDVVIKGCDELELVLRVRNNLRTSLVLRQVVRQKAWLEELVQQRTEELRLARREVLERLATAAEYRDDHTGAHTRRVGLLCTAIAEQLGQPQNYCKTIGAAALLHDLGKIGVPDAILLKPDKLSDSEYELIKEHTTIAADILQGCNEPLLVMAREIAITHHERWDGQGYPHGLRGGDIPLCGRIAAVADVFDAMTSTRPYKEAVTVEEARAQIARESGTHFDPMVVEAFLKIVGRFQEQEFSKAA